MQPPLLALALKRSFFRQESSDPDRPTVVLVQSPPSPLPWAGDVVAPPVEAGSPPGGRPDHMRFRCSSIWVGSHKSAAGRYWVTVTGAGFEFPMRTVYSGERSFAELSRPALVPVAAVDRGTSPGVRPQSVGGSTRPLVQTLRQSSQDARRQRRETGRQGRSVATRRRNLALLVSFNFVHELDAN